MAKSHHPLLERSLQEAMENYLGNRRLAHVQIRHVEGKNIEGFLTIVGGDNGRLLVDFRAVSASQGGFSYLEVGGSKVVALTPSVTKKARDQRTSAAGGSSP